MKTISKHLLAAILFALLFVLVAAINAEAHAMALPDNFDSGVTRQQSDLLASYYKDAAAKLKQVVRHPKGATLAAREFRQARAAEQLQQIDRILKQLKVRGSGWVGRNMPAVYRAGLLRADKQAIDAGIRPGGPIGGSFSLIDERSIHVLAIDSIGDLHKAADSMGHQAASVLRATAQVGVNESEINRILAGGLIEGQPVQTIRTLRDALKKVHGETVEINGRNFDVSAYAELVARTKTREAVETARHSRLQEHGIDLVSIVGRVSDSFCTAFLGQVFSLSGNHPKYPALDSLPGGGPPFHPNCSKSTGPFIDELATDKQLERADGVDDAHKLIGMTPSEAQRSYKDLQIRQQVEPAHRASGQA